MEDKQTQQALEVLGKVFGSATTAVVEFLSKIIIDAVLASPRLAEHIEKTINQSKEALVESVEETVKETKYPLVRQALLLAFKQLDWWGGFVTENDFSETAVVDAYTACTGHDTSSVELIVTKLVEWLPDYLKRFKSKIITELGFKLNPALQAKKIDIVSRRAYMTGVPIKDIVDEAVTSGELKRSASGLKGLRSKESPSQNPASDLAGLSDFSGETESET